MATDSTIDRKTFLTSVLAWAALSLSGCSDGGAGGGTGGAGGGAAGQGGAGGAGAAGGDGGTTIMCTSVVEMVLNHTHPLTVPGSDVERGYQDTPYLLEDGGTGHTHTLTLSGYDFAYLQAGVTRSVESSTTLDHTHPCDVTCTGNG
ncbi:MAG TPA: hypothetical protein VMT03_16320 [Polyangia bacterium]|nr:hypothetical protein [Polyangia bacterium]